MDLKALEGIQAFVEAFVTEPRCQQGATATGGIDIKKIGDFLKWVSIDVEKESKDDLEVSGLTWKDVVQSVQKAARLWYLAQTKKL